MGWMLNVTLGTTAAESLNAAANIFLGQTEAPLLIRPFLPVMTKYVRESMFWSPSLYSLVGILAHFRSEIHAVMTGGFATIAGTVLAAYIRLVLVLCLARELTCPFEWWYVGYN